MRRFAHRGLSSKYTIDYTSHQMDVVVRCLVGLAVLCSTEGGLQLYVRHLGEVRQVEVASDATLQVLRDTIGLDARYDVLFSGNELYGRHTLLSEFGLSAEAVLDIQPAAHVDLTRPEAFKRIAFILRERQDEGRPVERIHLEMISDADKSPNATHPNIKLEMNIEEAFCRPHLGQLGEAHFGIMNGTSSISNGPRGPHVVNDLRRMAGGRYYLRKSYVQYLILSFSDESGKRDPLGVWVRFKVGGGCAAITSTIPEFNTNVSRCVLSFAY